MLLTAEMWYAKVRECEALRRALQERNNDLNEVATVLENEAINAEQRTGYARARALRVRAAKLRALTRKEVEFRE